MSGRGESLHTLVLISYEETNWRRLKDFQLAQGNVKSGEIKLLLIEIKNGTTIIYPTLSWDL